VSKMQRSTAPTPAELAAMVERHVGYPGNWRKLAPVLLDTALQAMTAIVAALEYRLSQENEPC